MVVGTRGLVAKGVVMRGGVGQTIILPRRSVKVHKFRTGSKGGGRIAETVCGEREAALFASLGDRGEELLKELDGWAGPNLSSAPLMGPIGRRWGPHPHPFCKRTITLDCRNGFLYCEWIGAAKTCEDGSAGTHPDVQSEGPFAAAWKSVWDHIQEKALAGGRIEPADVPVVRIGLALADYTTRSVGHGIMLVKKTDARVSFMLTGEEEELRELLDHLQSWSRIRLSHSRTSSWRISDVGGRVIG